ncbi:MAG: MBL fold metallo-hydrolase [Magnetococcus sp. YQC-5]
MSRYLELPTGITRIDVEYCRPGFTSAWLVREGNQAVFVETGPLPAVGILLGALTRHGMAPEAVQAVIVTHVHLDHAGGAGALLRHLPNACLLVHPRGLQHITDPSRLVAGAKVVYGEERFQTILGGAMPVDPSRIHCPTDGEVFSLCGRSLRFLDTPGHSLNHLCLLDEQTHGLFTGDAFGLSYREFDGGIRPLFLPATTPTQFDVGQMRATCRRLADLQPKWLYLTHFGPLPFVTAMGDDLDAQLEKYQQLVMETNEKNRLGDLTSALADMTKNQMMALQIPKAAMDQFDLLQMDLELNAQGLTLWHDRCHRRVDS